jgi:anti-sigma factor RsiW
MNHQAQLRLQAWLDGELPAAEAQAAAAWVQLDPEASALALELSGTKAALLGNELERTLPESREFYWSKIERDIARAQTRTLAGGRPAWLTGWVRFLAPAGLLAALALMVFAPMLPWRHGATLVSTAEIESPLDDISSFTFRSESEGMTVVWVNIN